MMLYFLFIDGAAEEINKFIILASCKQIQSLHNAIFKLQMKFNFKMLDSRFCRPKDLSKQFLLFY